MYFSFIDIEFFFVCFRKFALIIFVTDFFIFIKRNIVNKTLLIYFNVDNKYLFFIIDYHIVQY